MTVQTKSQARVYSGGCACGAIRFEARGEPYRVGLCHCLNCRKQHGTPFTANVVFPRDQVRVTGEGLGVFRSSETVLRHFCQACGSPVFILEDGSDEIDLCLGSFDETDIWSPTYELWVPRRETWLGTLPTIQCRYQTNRTGPQRTEP